MFARHSRREAHGHAVRRRGHSEQQRNPDMRFFYTTSSLQAQGCAWIFKRQEKAGLRSSDRRKHSPESSQEGMEWQYHSAPPCTEARPAQGLPSIDLICAATVQELGMGVEELLSMATQGEVGHTLIPACVPHPKFPCGLQPKTHYIRRFPKIGVPQYRPPTTIYRPCYRDSRKGTPNFGKRPYTQSIEAMR